jgi:hypothetical protein
MFERYTEKARRAIFFARYEASQFGEPYIQTEHLLLGLLREDHALANRFLRSHAAVESMRRQIEAHAVRREHVSTSVDLPLSHESKRVLGYGAEEADRLNHKQIGTVHLLLGLLREDQCFAAQLLREHGLTLASVREQAKHWEPGLLGADEIVNATFARVDQWLAEREALGGVRTVRQKHIANRPTHFAVYEVEQADENRKGEGVTPAQKLAEVQKRIDFAVERVEHAIANHEFEKARFYSDEERKERENLRLLCEQFNLESPPRAPFLCIEILGDEGFSEVQRRCDGHIAEGVTEVWLLDPGLRRAYTFTGAEGLREFRGETLQIANPPLELDVRRIFEDI